MAEEHLAILKQGVEVWNKWRQENGDLRPDFERADLRVSRLDGGDFRVCDFRAADLCWCNLIGADFEEADLSLANLFGSDLSGAKLLNAEFIGANLTNTNLNDADLMGTNFSQTRLYETIFADVDMTYAKGLDACDHAGPSVIDHRTLSRSNKLPISFLRGCGLPDRLIDYVPSLLEEAIQYYSCFISYSSKDEAFSKRLHADLENSGVRCWFAQHDLLTGAKIWDAIDEAIRVRDTRFQWTTLHPPTPMHNPG